MTRHISSGPFCPCDLHRRRPSALDRGLADRCDLVAPKEQRRALYRLHQAALELRTTPTATRPIRNAVLIPLEHEQAAGDQGSARVLGPMGPRSRKDRRQEASESGGW